MFIVTGMGGCWLSLLSPAQRRTRKPVLGPRLGEAGALAARRWRSGSLRRSQVSAPGFFIVCLFIVCAALFSPVDALAQAVGQMAPGDRAPGWPQGHLDMYSRIFWNTKGTLFVLIVIFTLLYVFLGNRKKSRRFLATYSVMYLSFIVYLYYDSFAGVSEFLRLCETWGGFRGEPIPKGSSVTVNDDLAFGCGVECGYALRDSTNVAFVEGRATAVDPKRSMQKVMYPAGRYRVSAEEGNSPLCEGLRKYEKWKRIAGDYKKAGGEFCYHFTPIEDYSAGYYWQRESPRDFAQGLGIGGSLTKLVNVKTGEVYSSYGEFKYNLGLIALLNPEHWFVRIPTIATCREYNAFPEMFGRYLDDYHRS